MIQQIQKYYEESAGLSGAVSSVIRLEVRQAMTLKAVHVSVGANVSGADAEFELKLNGTAITGADVSVEIGTDENEVTALEEELAEDDRLDLALISGSINSPVVLTLTVEVEGDELKADKTANINAQTGTSYSLQDSDNGKIVTLNNASAITLTVPSGLGAGFNCLIVQLGAGQVTISPSSTTVHNRQSHTKIAGSKGAVSLFAYAADTFILQGDTSS